jgi:hypothetical protein
MREFTYTHTCMFTLRFHLITYKVIIQERRESMFIYRHQYSSPHAHIRTNSYALRRRRKFTFEIVPRKQGNHRRYDAK